MVVLRLIQGIPQAEEPYGQTTLGGSLGPSIASQSTATDQVQVSRSDLWQKVERLEHMQRRIEERFGVSVVPIHTLTHSKWELRQPLNVAVEQRDADDFVACIYDVDLYGYGDSIPEALNDLKEAIINQFEYLIEEENKVELSKLLKNQLEFLKSILVSKNA